MRRKTTIVLIAVMVFIVQAACSLGSIVPQGSVPTQDVNSLVATNVALTQAAQIVIVPTNTSGFFNVPPINTTAPLNQPTNTTAPLILPTNTTAPLSGVTGVVNYGANCRTGPGANFPVVVILPEKTKVDITGKAKATDKSQWWLVRSSGNSDCWLIAAALAITGDTNSVPEVPSPATPTPLPPPFWGGDWTIWIWGYGDESSQTQTSLIFVQSGNNLTSTFFLFDKTFNFNGTVSDDGMTVHGNLNGAWKDGFNYNWDVAFYRNPSNLNQFRGAWGFGSSSNVGGWCGATNGASRPSPCLK